METAEAKEEISASPAVENSTQRIKEEPSFLHEESNSTIKEATGTEVNTIPITTNELALSSSEKEGNQNDLNVRQTIEEQNTNLTALSDEKTFQSTAEEHPKKDENVSSTATTPERPNNPTLSYAQTATATTSVKEEPSTAPDIPEDDDLDFDDLLRTADQISEQMSPPHIKEEDSQPNQLAPTVPSAAVNESIPTETPSNNTGVNGRSEDAAPEEIPSNWFDDLLEDRVAPNIKIKNEPNSDVASGAANVPDEETEAIPIDFFDDLLEDRVAKRMERLQNEEEEIKYSVKIKKLQQQLRELDETLAVDPPNKHKKHKHKKSKKKSNKRSRNKEDKDYSEFDLDDNASEEVQRKRRKHSRSTDHSLDDNDSEEVQRKRRKNSRSPAQSSKDDNDSEEVQRKRRKNSRSPAQSLKDDKFEEVQRRRRKNSRSPAQSSNDDNFDEVQRKRRKDSRSPVTTKKSNNMNNEKLLKVIPTSKLTINEAINQTAAVNYPVLGVPEELPGPSVNANFPVASVPDHIPNSSAAFSPFPLPFLIKPEPAILIPDANDDTLNCLPVEQPSSSSAFNAFSGFKKIKLEMPANKLNIKTEDIFPVTPTSKRQKALEQATKAIKQFQLAQNNPTSAEFNFTSTVRKLPTSSSYVTQQIYENRSPLHTINNVDFAFNSNSTRFNLHEWGLEAMPKSVAQVAKVIAYDADNLFAKLKATKNTNKFSTRKIKKEMNVGEAIDETKSSFFTNAMTQTDDVVIGSARKRKGHDIGMQATPPRASLGTQTTFQTGTAANNDLPLMRQINQLNENQLLALNDFAELMLERNSSTAVDMYSLRQRMLEIYKCSQMSSAVPGPASARTSANASIATNLNPHYQNPAPMAVPTNVAVAPNLNYQNNAQPVYRARPINNTVSNAPTQYLQPNSAGAQLNQIPVFLRHQPHPQQPHPQQPHPHQPHPQQPHPQQPHPQQLHPQQSHPQQLHPHQPHPPSYQLADPRVNAGFPMQPMNPEYQTVPPSNYQFPQIPPNPVSPPSDSGIKYYGRGGMRR